MIIHTHFLRKNPSSSQIVSVKTFKSIYTYCGQKHWNDIRHCSGCKNKLAFDSMLKTNEFMKTTQLKLLQFIEKTVLNISVMRNILFIKTYTNISWYITFNSSYCSILLQEDLYIFSLVSQPNRDQMELFSSYNCSMKVISSTDCSLAKNILW